MEVDWITVAAQIINFLVLVWLLKRFLYGPIIGAMDEREARIAESLQEAESEREAAAAEANNYREMQQNFDAQREAGMRQAQEEAERLRRSLQSEAREEVATLRSEWISNLADEKDAFLDDIRQRSAEAFSAMARVAFADLANEGLEDQIARRFAKALRSFDAGELKKLKAACSRTGEGMSVRTSFDLSRRSRSEITAAIRGTMAEEADVVFETSPDLICGVELRVGGQVVRWSLESFLDEVEADLRLAVESRTPETDIRAAE